MSYNNDNTTRDKELEHILSQIKRIAENLPQNENEQQQPIPNFIKVTPVSFVRDIPKEWDVTFMYDDTFLGVIEEIKFGEYMFTDDTGRNEMTDDDLQSLVMQIQNWIDFSTKH